MTKKVLGLGTTPNDRTGDSLRAASGKINDNFDELYAALGNGTALSVAAVAKTGNYNDLLGKPSFNGFNIVSVPSSLSATGSPRDAAIGAIDNINYLFICTSTNTWKKIALRDDPLVLVNPPQNTYGKQGDRKGLLAVDENSLYYCIGDYVDNSTEIWKSISWGGNSNDQNIFDENGVLQLPDGGTIAEGVVTDNPTIELTPANFDVESQKLVIKGGGPGFSNTENGITIVTYNLTAASGNTAYFEVFSEYAGETFYWWVDNYSPGQEFFPDNSEITLSEFGYANIEFTVNDDTVPLRIYVADTLYNAYANSKGAVSVTVNGESQDSYHLHLTTGDLSETSIFLGTDELNVRTTTNGTIQITTPTEGSNVWEFGTDGSLTFPNQFGKINPNVSDGIGLQLEASLDFEIKVNPYEGASSIWSFAGNDITFPNNTVQRTAWAGGRVTSTPSSSIGSSEDRAGDISFDDNYMYYCTNDYGGSITTLQWSNVIDYSGYVQATIPYAQSLANGRIQITNNAVNGVTGITVQVDSYELVSDNTYKLYITEPGWEGSYQNSELQVLSGSDIWRRVAWSNDTW